MGSSTFSNKGGVPKGIKINEEDENKIEIEGDDQLIIDKLSKFGSLDELFNAIDEIIKDDGIDKFKNTKIKLPKRVIERIAESYFKGNSNIGKLFGKVGKNFKSIGGIGTIGGGFAGGSLISKTKDLDDFSELADKLELNRHDIEILEPAVVGHESILDQITLDPIEDKYFSGYNDKSTIAIWSYIIAKNWENESLRRGIQFENYKIVEGVSAACKNKFKKEINITKDDFEESDLQDFIGVSHE